MNKEKLNKENKMNQDTTIPIGLQTLLTELDFLSQISNGKKPSITNMILMDKNSWLDAFKRFWKGENRDNVMSKIEQIVSRTVDAIINHKNTVYIGLIVNKLNEAQQGISSLSSTYHDDPKMIARIRVQIQNIDLQLENYRHLIKGYKNVNNINEETEQDDKTEPEVEINLGSDFFGNTSSERRKLRRHRLKKSADKQS